MDLGLDLPQTLAIAHHVDDFQCRCMGCRHARRQDGEQRQPSPRAKRKPGLGTACNSRSAAVGTAIDGGGIGSREGTRRPGALLHAASGGLRANTPSVHRPTNRPMNRPYCHGLSLPGASRRQASPKNADGPRNRRPSVSASGTSPGSRSRRRGRTGQSWCRRAVPSRRRLRTFSVSRCTCVCNSRPCSC